MTDTGLCCLCASDEGVFLDIFTGTRRQLGNRSFVEEFETCFSLKVTRNGALSSKICHRCAIELGQCNQFVRRHNEIQDTTAKIDERVLNKSCYLCLSTGQKSCLFILAKDFCSKIDPLQKIYECFNEQITREQAESRLICLSCRYNLDVLYDLKKLARNTENRLQRIAECKTLLAGLPKTETSVVNRKTTVICQSTFRLRTPSVLNSKSDKMARRGSRLRKLETQKSAVESKLRTCAQCHTSIDSGVDMYRLHSTGVTVCRMCWITMDPFNPNKATKRKRKNQQEVKNTRLCAVFLTDVMSSAASKNDIHSKNDKDAARVISDDSSNSKASSSVTPKINFRKRHVSEINESDQNSENNSNTKIKLRSKQNKATGDGESIKKLKPNKDEEKAVTTRLTRSSRYQSSDSEGVKGKSKQGKVANKGKNISKVSDVESGDKGKKTKMNKTDGKRKKVAPTSGKSKSEDSASWSDSEDGRGFRKVRNKVPLILKPKVRDSSKTRKNAKRTNSRPTIIRESPAASKNSNPRSMGKNKTAKSKASIKKAKSLITTTDRTFTVPELLDASCPLTSVSTNETPPQPEVPTSTSPLGSEEDQPKKSAPETEDKVISVRETTCSSSVQNADKSADIYNAEEPDAVSSSNSLGSLVEESTSVTEQPTTVAAESNTVEELNVQMTGESNKNDTSVAEADSAIEVNPSDRDVTAKESNGTIDDEAKSEGVEITVDKHEVNEETANKKDDIVLPSSEPTTSEVVDGDRDSDEEVESDTDIRIIDSGSSTEENRERREKRGDDARNENNVAADKNEDDESAAEKTESKPGEQGAKDLEDKPDVNPKTISYNDEGATINSNGASLPSEGDVSSEKGEKIDEEVRPTNPESEILQEVIDLAVAEVQKRSVETEVSSVPEEETLENISKEIEKTGEESAVEKETCSNVDKTMNNESESCNSDLNFTENSSKK